MSYWFDKGDARRFPRINMPVPLYLAATNPIRDHQIYAMGIDYFPPSVSKRIQFAKLNLIHWQNLIQEQKDILDPVFYEATDLVDHFREAIIGVSNGKMPLDSDNSLATFAQKARGFESFNNLQEHAPKTYNYFKLMNEKFIAYKNHFYLSMKKSSPTQFSIDPNLPGEFPIDKTIKSFAQPKFEQVPLAQSLLYLSRYIDYHCRAYIELLKDYAPRQNAKRWATSEVNISASGFAINLNKRFKATSKVDAFLYFEDTDEIVKLNATTVRTKSIADRGYETNAFDFNFPTHQDQSLIKRQLERYQIKRCMALPV